MKGGKRALAVLGIAVAVSLFGASAHAGHGTVSDVLVGRNVYLPDEPRVCPQLASALNKLTDRVMEEGYPLKVAIISSRADLGGAPAYFGRPQDYARFLGSQIGFYHPGYSGPQTNESLLIVMPAGFGFVRSGKAANVFFAVLGLEGPKGDHPNDLARAAIGAVRELASAAGHPVPKVSSECSGSGRSSALVYVVPTALILLAAAVITLIARRGATKNR
jgi:hypothetical protein